MKPRLLDLFSGAGGCTRGYQLAGFHVTGVDLHPQPNFIGDEFHQADALTFPLEGFDAIHASPPCQAFTKAQKLQAREHPDLIAPTRERLIEAGAPWVIENVPGAPLRDPILLCGTMFGLPLYRHRLFESSVPLTEPLHGQHWLRQVKMGRRPGPDEIRQPVGHFSGVAAARAAMGTPWMTRGEMAQAIPPAFTEYIGSYLMAELNARAAA